MTNHPNRSQRPHNPKMTMTDFRQLALRSDFDVVQVGKTYRLVELVTRRRVPNRDGGYEHKNVAELYESLGEAAH